MGKRLASVMAMVAALAGPSAMAEVMDEAMSLREDDAPKPFSAERLQHEVATGAGNEALVKGAIPEQKEGERLEVIQTRRRAPRGGASFGEFAGKPCLAWIGRALRMVKHENGLPATAELVKVVYVRAMPDPKRGRRDVVRQMKRADGFVGTLAQYVEVQNAESNSFMDSRD